MDTPDLTAGMVLDGRYEIESVLGRGGMASVYRARDTLLGRVVAIKLFAPTGADAAELRRETSEVQVLAGLAHPAIVTLFDARVDDADRAYLVMEFVEGPTLQTLVSEGPLTPATAAAMLADLGEALHVAHEGGVVHRDVKPANILLAPVPGGEGRYRAKLADFGIAYLVDSTRLTATGTVMGTAAFISPEQALGQPIEPPSDVYSLGLVALEALTGTRVFTGSAIESVMARLHNDPIVPSSLETGWASLLTSMTARDPEARPTALEVSRRASRLASAARGGDTSDLASVPDPTEPINRSDRTMVLPAAAAAAAAAGVAGAGVAGAAAADAPTAAYGAGAGAGADAPTAAYGAGADAPTAAYGANAPTSSYSNGAPGSDAPTERFAPAVALGSAATGGGVAAGAGAGGSGAGGGPGDFDRASSGRRRWVLPVIIVAVLALIAGAVVWGITQGGDGDGAPVESSQPSSGTPSDDPSGEATTPAETTEPQPEQTEEAPAPAQPSEETAPEPTTPSESTGEDEPDENEPDENEPDENEPGEVPVPEATVPGTGVGTGAVTGPGNSGSNPNSGPGNNNGNGKP
ncbi:protein kinase domain-containing protein [Frigoribacterium sp. CFBP9030]|uniref:protein kinase domain-containing protein n=1 Tax=Frigoribacterium sp. CFBP9030 TaxID=3096537 RepID=UPI002A6A54D5|nr:protein kinase [Frigoribacterium sp. CFBP9030]MDY0893266.1 protein kinase [Frigoribacterium sp. CFBP9030]